MYARRLQGKVAVVTGSTEGIGFAIARRLGKEGAQVVISSRKQSNVDRAIQELRKENIDVFGLVCHVAKPEDRRHLLEEAGKQFGGIDILVCNAGVNAYIGPFLETPEGAWDKVFNTNVKATFFMIKEAVPYMKRCRGGSITIVSSLGAYTPKPQVGSYAISKTALLGMVKALVPELALSKIRINGLVPGVVKTKYSAPLLQNKAALEAVMKEAPMAEAFGRLAEPDDIVGVVAMLSSDDALFITGENIIVSGGMTSRL